MARRYRDPIRTAVIQEISGDRCAITFDGIKLIRGVSIVGDPSLISPGSTVLVEYVDNRPVVLCSGSKAPASVANADTLGPTSHYNLRGLDSDDHTQYAYVVFSSIEPSSLRAGMIWVNEQEN